MELIILKGRGATAIIGATFRAHQKRRKRHNIPFYIYPSQRGGWAFKTIGKTPTDMKNHLMDIPDEVRTWEGVTFLHPTCFLGSAKTKERAIEIVQTIVNQNAAKEDPNPCCGNA